MRTDYEYVTLGLGDLSSAATDWQSRSAGRDVLGLEQFELTESHPRRSYRV